jgi:hypothetical protein
VLAEIRFSVRCTALLRTYRVFLFYDAAKEEMRRRREGGGGGEERRRGTNLYSCGVLPTLLPKFCATGITGMKNY